MKRIGRGLAALVAITLTACDGNGDKGGVTEPAPSAPVASLELNHSSVTMARMQDFSLAAVAKDAAGQALTGRVIAWKTSDPAVVTVREDGTLVGVQRGTATVTASAEGKTASATVTVVVLTSVTAGLDESCAISETGKLYCAGERYGRRARLVSPDLRFKAVASGARMAYTCAIATDERLYCWGENSDGQLGVGDVAPRSTPTPVVGALKFKSIALGLGHACGIITDGSAYCWGRGSSGQLGQVGSGPAGSSPIPVRVSGGMKFTQVTAGRLYSCGLAEDRRAYCWGENEHGHMGRGPSAGSSAVPLPVSGDHVFKTITGAGAACALTLDGTAYCWGDNTLFKLGASTTETCFGDKPCSTVPVPVETELRFATISSSAFGTCALDPGGTVYCWGMNVDGKFGTALAGSCPIRNAPAPCTKTPTAGPTGFITLSTGPNTTCGIHSNGGAYCWGGNDRGQLARPEVIMSEKPLPFSLDPTAEP